MPENFIVFTLNGVDWRLSRICFTAAGVMALTFAVLLGLVLYRYGKVRKLSGSEAASVAMHAGEVGSVDRAVARHGYATGAEVRVSISIGDLREAYHAKDWFKFFALHIAILCMFNSVGVLLFGSYLLNRDKVALVLALLISLPTTSLIVFTWWAAINTKLE